MRYTLLFTLATMPPVMAATLVTDDFSGLGGDPINGTSPDINELSSTNWLASEEIPNGYIRANGSAYDFAGNENNVDRGAYLDLGSGFFQSGLIYTLTLDFGQIDNAGIFAGFTNVTTPDLTARAQTQGTANLAIQVDDFGGSGDSVSIWNRVGTTDNVTVVDSNGNGFNDASYLASMTIDTTSLTDATIEVTNGLFTNTITNVDLSEMRWLYIGYEDALPSDDQGLLADVNSITLTAIPEPKTAVLSILGILGVLLRRRR